MAGSGERAVKGAATSMPVRLLARTGLLAYGVVHLLIAWLAVQVALGGGGKADKNGALQAIAVSTGGRWVLWITAVGLGALVIWQLAEAVWGQQQRGARRWLGRTVHVAEAVLFGYLAYAAARIAASHAAPSDASQRFLVARVLTQPYGKHLVTAGGLGVLIVAIVLVHRGLTRDFRRNLDLSSAEPAMRRIAVRLGQIGYAALGVVYGIAGALVVVAAVRSDPGKATGLDTALKTLAAQPYGVVLLLIVAAGLAAFGVFAVLDARYRRA